MLISAPGKALLCGEYAVLEGGTALVTAVDRRVTADTSGALTGRDEVGPEVYASRREAERTFGRARSEPRFDTSALFSRKQKLGLGSSAAASVAAVATVAVEHGADLGQRSVRDRVFGAALAGHRAVAPGGSGADVAASTYGGLLSYRCDPSGTPTFEHVRPPTDLHLSLVWTGSSARTSEFVSRIEAFRQANPRSYGTLIDKMKDLADSFLEAIATNQTRRAVAIGARYHEQMRQLGDRSNAPIVTAPLHRIAEWAAVEGGSAKPCGAGGGDVAIAFFESRESALRFEAHCRSGGFSTIDCKWAVAGVERVT